MQHDSAAISQFLILNSQLNKIRKPVRLGGKEGTEEFSFGLFADSGTIVNDFYESGGSGPYRYFTLLACRFAGALYTFGSILDDIYQNLLEQ